MNHYKVYPANQYYSLDLSLFYSPIRWSNDLSEFIVEFRDPPHGNTVTINLQEARDLMKQVEWCADSSIFEATF